MALPGSTYLYQGEELGLSEVADILAGLIQDPVFARTQGAEKGRDGCRVPLPHGSVIVTSAPVEGNQLPADATAWILNGSLAA